MFGLSSRFTVLAVAAGAGIGLFAFVTVAAHPNCAASLGAGSGPAAEFGLERGYVQLPQPGMVRGLGMPPQSTPSPLPDGAGAKPYTPAGGVIATPTEDPYAG